MTKIDNLIGKRFGKLVVIEELPCKLDFNTKWKVRCDCGKEIIRTGHTLVYGNSTHCGCVRKKKLTKHTYDKGTPGGKNFKDETGNIYGRLTVLRPTQQNKKREWYWECRCSCGNLTEVRGSHLRKGSVISCGCYKREKQIAVVTTHGLSQTKKYHRAMLRRRERAKAKLDKNWTGEMEHQLRTLFGHCVLCGITEKEHQEKYGQALHVDHVRPLKNGNGLDYGNATILCAECNRKKHAKTLDQLDQRDRNRIRVTAELFDLLYNKNRIIEG